MAGTEAGASAGEPPTSQPLSTPAVPTSVAPKTSWPVELDRAQIIATELSLRRSQVASTLQLLEDGATLPFIARYRKEMTEGMDEVQIAAVQERGAYLSELFARKTAVLSEIHKQGKLSPLLEKKLLATLSKTELEDLYLPYKPKRRTRATIAKDKGLEPLGLLLLAQEATGKSRQELATPFVVQSDDAAKAVPDIESALAGARDIVAELISDDAGVRAALRSQAIEQGTMRSRLIAKRGEPGAAVDEEAPEPGNEREPQGDGRDRSDGKKEDPTAKYSDYFEYEEPVKQIPSHRMLALRRGEKEGVLRVTLEMDRDQAVAAIERQTIKKRDFVLATDLLKAIADAWERLLKPAIEVDVRLSLRERADGEAIRVFAENLRHLLLSAPLGTRRVLALDPGYRTGCKTAVLDEKGDLLAHDVIYPTQSESRRAEATTRLEKLLGEHKIQAIAIGNGTASRETESFVRRLSQGGKIPGVKVVVVNEAGASVYSTSEIGRQELPTYDATVRGAVSIGRRLQDPLAELVKIEPKSIGVGQYQHDVHQPTLKKQLDQVVESCVNQVGVDINTASPKLLQYVAGIGESLAKGIVAHRSQSGPFTSRAQLLDVPRLGAKAYEQAAGFLRVRDGAQSPLDNSSVHPESYDIVAKMASDLGVDVAGLIGNRALIAKVNIQQYVDARRGEPTLRDILAELEKPGRDPRKDFEEVGFNPDVTEVKHLKDGMVLSGVVTNVTAFGAFVDVGVHQDGLVHISELSHKFIKDPAEAVKVGDKVKVKVIKIELDRMRIGLSIKQATEPPAQAGDRPASPRPERAPRPARSEDNRGTRPAQKGARPEAPPRREGNKPAAPPTERAEDKPRERRPAAAAAPPAPGRPRTEAPRAEQRDGAPAAASRPAARNDARPASPGGDKPRGGSPFNTIKGLGDLRSLVKK